MATVESSGTAVQTSDSKFPVYILDSEALRLLEAKYGSALDNVLTTYGFEIHREEGDSTIFLRSGFVEGKTYGKYAQKLFERVNIMVVPKAPKE